MSTAATIVADVRAVVAHLAELDESAVRIAQALDVWLRGTDFEAAIGLPAGWRRHLQQVARVAALDALLAMDPNIEAKAVADGVKRAARRHGDRRPDGRDGYFFDLRADAHLTERAWRGLVAQVRGNCNGPKCRDAVPPSAKGD